MVRRTLYGTDVHYPTGINYCEDLYVNICLLLKNPVISYVPQAFYHYILDFNSDSMGKRLSAGILDKDLELYYGLEKLLIEYSDILDLFRPSMSVLILKRAFRSGIYSSGEFKNVWIFASLHLLPSKRTTLLQVCLLYLLYGRI